MHGVYVFAVLLAAVFTGGANAIQCYHCNYTSLFKWYMPFCGETFRASGAGPSDVIECNVCEKEFGKLGSVESYGRGCYEGTLAECEKETGCGDVPGTNGQIAGCRHCCDTELCNGATSVTFNFLATTAMFGIATTAMLVVAWTNTN